MPFSDRRLAAEDLSKHCAPERWAHLLISLASVGGLLFLAATILGPDPNWKTAVTMFGPAGIIAASQSRVLLIWNQIASILMGTYR